MLIPSSCSHFFKKDNRQRGEYQIFLRRAGLPRKLLLQRLVLCGVPRISVHVSPGVLRERMPAPGVPQQLLLPSRNLRQLDGTVRVRDDLLAVQQHPVRT